MQTREQFAHPQARVATDMSADVLQLRSTIGLVIALAVIALGLMSATLNRLRDFAVIKALGARTPPCGRVGVLVLLTVALAFAVATTAARILAWLLPLAGPGGPDLDHHRRPSRRPAPPPS